MGGARYLVCCNAMQCKAMQSKAKALCVSTKGWIFLMEKKPAMTFARNGKANKKSRRLDRRQKTPSLT